MNRIQNNPVINSIFPTPVYIVKRDSLDSTEEKEIEDIIEEGMHRNRHNSTSNNSYIFNNDNLKNLKQFCEQQLKIYVEKSITPTEVDIYITQSWINVTRPGENHHSHYHPNSIISGVFYISTEEDDNIMFMDPNDKLKNQIVIDTTLEEWNIWNSPNWCFPVSKNELILFPSWLQHTVEPNDKATTDRISISFNTFVRGKLGEKNHLNELII